MENSKIAHRLAEELRTNKGLRNSIGLSDNSQILTAENSSSLWMENEDGKARIVEVRNA